MRTKLLATVLCSALALGQTGCLKSMILNGQIKSTRTGAGAADTIGDYELARSAASAGLLQFEGMHRLAPDNEDALFLLTKGWAGYGYAFPQDDYETAKLAGNDEVADYHKHRALLAFDRGVAYGLELLGKSDEGFAAAKKNVDTLKAWLADNFDDKEDAEVLFWVGSGWLARVNLMKDDDDLGPAYVSELFVGVAMLERSRALDPEYMAWGATSTLGVYHARARVAELDQAKQMLDEAIAKTNRKSLGVLVNYGKYACVSGDRALYEKVLQEVVDAGDVDPNLRLQNTIAKRRAKRGLSKEAIEECGFPEPATEPSEPASEPASAAPAPVSPAPTASAAPHAPAAPTPAPAAHAPAPAAGRAPSAAPTAPAHAPTAAPAAPAHAPTAPAHAPSAAPATSAAPAGKAHP